MGLNPLWTGELHDYLTQYEQMAKCFINGHIYFEEVPGEDLLAMPNPYSHSLREQNGVEYLWDHAFYNGRYYMYFGVVPLILLFIPFKLLTGFDLASFHATQIFVALFIIGIFTLFRFLQKTFFQEVSSAIYLFVSAAVSIMCSWNSAAAPALYSTAQTSALCLGCWSLFFYFKAVYSRKPFKTTLVYAVIGSTLGALTFGCRPSVALFVIAAIPLFITYYKKVDEGANRIKLFFCFLPFFIVGFFLMYYNYLRFNNPFEFGQTYQLTITDQTDYAEASSRVSFSLLIHSFYYHLIKIPVTLDLLKIGVLISYPVLLLALLSLFFQKVQSKLWNYNMFSVSLSIYFAVVLIVFSIGIYSPFPLPRYRMDFAWLLGIVSFIIVCATYQTVQNKRRYSFFVSSSAVLSIIVSICQYFYPWDENITVYNPLILDSIQKLLTFGI